jgi:hypothetical protein
MNKVVVVLGIIVLITLAMLFFCVGFFTGSTITPTEISETLRGVGIGKNDKKDDKKITIKDIDELTDTNSATISSKIIDILNAAGYATDSFSRAMRDANKNRENKEKHLPKMLDGESRVTVNSLLREIAATHSPHDDCSYHKTMMQIHEPKPIVDKGLHGKKIVFIGYFKNSVAVQVQKLLISKGYKAHVEQSKGGDNSDSFVFCGPFKKDENAKKLVDWLAKHDFAEAKMVNISKEAIEETLYDVINDDGNSMPINAEKEIPSASSSTSVPAPPANMVTAVQPAAAAQPVVAAQPVAPVNQQQQAMQQQQAIQQQQAQRLQQQRAMQQQQQAAQRQQMGNRNAPAASQIAVPRM